VTRRFSPAARALLAAITLVLSAFMASVVPAAATPADPPQSGDPRATVYPGNAVTCEDAGLAGEIVEIEFVIDESNHFIDIISVPSDIELTGTVVKGGNAYNVYGPEESLELHAPLNPGGIAEISHWYVCGQEVSTTTSETTTTEETPAGSPLKDDETAPEESTTTTDETDVAPATSPAAVAAANASPDGGGDSGGLANTGFSGSGLLLAGTGLLVLGLGLVFGVWASRRRGDNTSG
jgi:hypothetical protein